MQGDGIGLATCIGEPDAIPDIANLAGFSWRETLVFQLILNRTQARPVIPQQRKWRLQSGEK